LYTVLESQLATDGDYLVGDKYSAVDISSECRLSTFYAASVLIVSS
jgi:glutathione S-transferase